MPTGTSRSGAIQARNAWIAEIESRDPVAIKGMPTFAQYAARWLADLEINGRVKPDTLVGYRSAVDKWGLPRFGDMRLDEIRVTDVGALTDEIIRQGRTSRTAASIQAALSVMMTEAEREELVVKNVFKIARKPSQRPSKPRGAYTAGEARLILAAASEHGASKLLIVSLAAFGLRRGEILAIRDEDFTAGRTPILHIRGSITRIKGQGLVRVTPKSATSVRQIPIPQVLVRLIQQVQADRDARKTQAGGLWSDQDGLIIQQSTGGALDPDEVSRWFGNLLDKVISANPDLNMVKRDLHSLRHTAASIAHAAGIDDKRRQELLGHASMVMTMHYTDPDQNALMGASDALAEVLFDADSGHEIGHEIDSDHAG